MKTIVKNDAYCFEYDIDRELLDVLNQISIVSKRIAGRLAAYSKEENLEGENLNGKNKRIICTYR